MLNSECKLLFRKIWSCIKIRSFPSISFSYILYICINIFVLKIHICAWPTQTKTMLSQINQSIPVRIQIRTNRISSNSRVSPIDRSSPIFANRFNPPLPSFVFREASTSVDTRYSWLNGGKGRDSTEQTIHERIPRENFRFAATVGRGRGKN